MNLKISIIKRQKINDVKTDFDNQITYGFCRKEVNTTLQKIWEELEALKSFVNFMLKTIDFFRLQLFSLFILLRYFYVYF